MYITNADVKERRAMDAQRRYLEDQVTMENALKEAVREKDKAVWEKDAAVQQRDEAEQARRAAEEKADALQAELDRLMAQNK